MPRVSVVLPFRDAADTLIESVRSILAQDFRDFELVAVDDGSRDGGAARLSGIDDRRLVCCENRGSPGVVGATNTGAAKARGEWIARMDADDVAMPDRLGRQLAAGEGGAGVVTCGVALTHSCGLGMERYVDWVNSLDSHARMSVSRFIECPVINPTSMVRRDWYERVGGYRESEWAEDHDLWLRLLELDCPFVRVPEVLLHWRDSPERLTRRDARYGDAARSRMRAHYLARLPGVKAGGAVIAGAGPIGKRLARDLIDEGVTLHGFFEVSRRRIGQRIHGVEVASADEAAWRWRDAVMLGAVGIEGGRAKTRELAEASGRREGEDFWAVC
jgi:glycosyltransferase involved in cell wall biosynthesis